MKKAVWIAFGVSLVLVNLISWLVFQFTGVYIIMIFRVTLVLGITLITLIFAGSLQLIKTLDQERPLTGHAKNSVGKDGAIETVPPTPVPPKKSDGAVGSSDTGSE